jgi:hypothetical protein
VRYVYRVDPRDTICFVSPSWLRFAQENDAAELNEDRVLGRVIWDFVEGVEVRRLYATLFSSLRARREEIVVPFRCDSPGSVRLMELTLRLLPPAGIELEGRLLEERTRKPVALFFRGLARSPDAIPICGLCRRLFVQSRWLEAEQALARARLVDGALLPRLVESLCVECRSAVE